MSFGCFSGLGLFCGKFFSLCFLRGLLCLFLFFRIHFRGSFFSCSAELQACKLAQAGHAALRFARIDLGVGNRFFIFTNRTV